MQIGDGACIGEEACEDAGYGYMGNGYALIGNVSCNGKKACGKLGYAKYVDGYAVVGKDSCVHDNGDACAWAGYGKNASVSSIP